MRTVKSNRHNVRVNDVHPAVLTCVVCEFGDGILKVYVAIKVVAIQCTPPTVLKVTLGKVDFFLQVLDNNVGMQLMCICMHCISTLHAESLPNLHEFGGCWSRLSHILSFLRQACKASGRRCSCFLFAVQLVVSNDIAIEDSHPSRLSTALTTESFHRSKKSSAERRMH